MVGALDLKFRPDIKMIRQGAGKSARIESKGESPPRPAPIDLLTPGSQRPDWKNGRAWR